MNACTVICFRVVMFLSRSSRLTRKHWAVPATIAYHEISATWLHNMAQIPAEIFSTRYRCTCYRTAAASGKLGSWLVQIFLAYALKSKSTKDQCEWEKNHFGQILQVTSAFMTADAITTYFLVPETLDHNNKSRTLVVLACGRMVIDELNQQRSREDEDDS